MKTPSTGLEKIPAGISGLDEILSGSIPKERTALGIGEAGAGNTVLILKMLIKASRQHQRRRGAFAHALDNQITRNICRINYA